MSLRLQTLCLAIFDAILVYMLNQLAPGGKWLALKLQILEALLDKKDAKTVSVLTGTYAGTDVLFLQEVAASAFMAKANGRQLGEEYHMLKPAKCARALCARPSRSRFRRERDAHHLTRWQSSARGT